MSNSCCSTQPKFDGASTGFRRALWLVIAINAIMFFVEMGAGLMSGSQALKADALDFLGDTFTYAISLFVIGMSLRARTAAALFKGISLGVMGVLVFGFTIYRTLVLGMPDVPAMGVIGFSALAANMVSVLVLMRYRDGDANVRSVWLCSRNDAIGNVAVILAAGGVWLTGTPWPDLFVAGLMAGLFLRSAFLIISQALDERRGMAMLSIE